MTILPLGLIVGLICFVYFRRKKDPASQLIFLRKLALGTMLVIGVLGTIFIIGKIMADPGGIKGILYSAAWLLPTTALSYLAWRRPKIATPYIWMVCLLSIVISISLAVDPSWWSDFMDKRGAILPMIIFAVGLLVGIWAWHRNTIGGLLLIANGLALVVCSFIAFGLGISTATASISAASAPSVISGLLYLLPERKFSYA
jgi:hypothetical protein